MIVMQGDDTMKKTYKELTLGMNHLRQRDYLMNVCQDEGLTYILAHCYSKKELNKVLSHEKIKRELYENALEKLHEASDYETLQYHLIHMNSLFHYQSYIELKMNIFSKMTQSLITVNEYLVLRCLLKIQSLELFIHVLHTHYHVSALECAKIALIEDQYHLAYTYLKELEDCHDEAVLDLLCSYSVKDYLSLMHHYHKKQRDKRWERECFTY